MKTATIPVYAFNVRHTKRMKAGIYFTVADLPSNALVQLLYAADIKNRDVIQQFAKDAGFASVEAMCRDLDKGAYIVPELFKILKDPIINFTTCEAEHFDVNSLVGAKVRGLLPTEPQEFLKWYETKLK